MKGWIHQARWWQLALPVIAVIAIAYVAVAESASAGVFAALAVVAAVFTVWNPFETLPQPKLSLEQADGTEGEHFALESLGSVDVEAIAENAGAEARANKPLKPFLSLQGYAQPTAADHEEYERDVEQYEQEIRKWATEAKEWLEEQALIFEGRVIMRNTSSVDAKDAGLYLTFPTGSKPLIDPPKPPDPPERPKFPLRKSALAIAMDPSSGVGSWFSQRGTGLSFKPPDLESVASIWDPDYEVLRDGRLLVTYPRQNIHHGEREAAGRPFRVKLPMGENLVSWEAHAANLPRHSSGHWKITTEAPRSPISSLFDLENALGLNRDEDE